MAKDAPLAFRIHSQLKAKLQHIADMEGRSISQICDLFLTAGVTAYEERGSGFIREIVSRKKKREEKG